MRTPIESLKEIRDRLTYFCLRTDGKYDPPWVTELVGIIDESVTDCNHLGNAAAMREALESARNWCLNRLGNASYQVTVEGLLSVVNAALSEPARNCDRPECATSKGAQDVWRKEDSGKTPYYEWLLAPAAERKGE